MVLIGLLLVALVCLALGLVLASPGWLIASLAVTAIAACVMWAKRKEISAPPAAAAAAAAPPADAEPEAHAGESGAVDEEYQQRRAAWFAEGTAEGRVWVAARREGRADPAPAGDRGRLRPVFPVRSRLHARGGTRGGRRRAAGI